MGDLERDFLLDLAAMFDAIHSHLRRTVEQIKIDNHG